MPFDAPLDTGSARALAAYALLTVAVCWFAAGVPLVARARYRAIAAGAVDRVAVYRRMLARQWLVVGIVVGALALLGERLDDLGLRWGAASATLAVVAAGVVVLLGLTVPPTARAARDPAAAVASPPPGAALLPVSRRERRWFAAVAVGAGVAEEIVYRGLALRWLAETAPVLGTAGAVAVAAAVFGLAHAYQGARGVGAAAGGGWVLGSMYVATGSLVAPMVLHALTDLRALALTRVRRGAVSPALTSTFPSSDAPPEGAR